MVEEDLPRWRQRGLTPSPQTSPTALGLSLAPKTQLNFVGRSARLYEHGADHSRIGRYVQHWLLWATTGVSLASHGLSQLRKSLTNIVALYVKSTSPAVTRVA